MNIEHISVSRWETYQTCPARYRYRYHLKLESPEPEPFYFTYGKIVHKIAEEYILNKGKKELKEVCGAVLQGEIPIEDYASNKQKAPPLPPDYRNRLKSHIRAIHHLTEQIGFEGELEYPFEYDLVPPHEKYLVGVIDRLIHNNDEFFIIDYKTTKRGKWRKTKETIKKDLQLRCYSRVIQKLFDVPADKIKAALYYVEGGNLIGATFSEKALEAAESEMREGYKQIEAHDPDKVWGRIGRHCDRCEYRSICTFINKPKLPPNLRASG
jgi:RecB family exonuclease